MTFGKTLAYEPNLYFENNGDVIFRNMTENRKRLREEDTNCEFMPLSKRINNLHLNNNLTNTPLSQTDSNRPNTANTENGIPSPCSSSESERRPSYDPLISSTNNSYYYENKLLFELHIERLQRTGQEYLY